MAIGPQVVHLRKDQTDALQSLGVPQASWPAFLNGAWVKFEFPAKGGHSVYGFIRLCNGELSCQLFSINNTDTMQAALAFRRFVQGSVAVGRAFGLAEVELQGGTLINLKLAASLQNRGFATKTVDAPDSVGNDPQDVYWQKVRIPPQVQP